MTLSLIYTFIAAQCALLLRQHYDDVGEHVVVVPTKDSLGGKPPNSDRGGVLTVLDRVAIVGLRITIEAWPLVPALTHSKNKDYAPRKTHEKSS